MKNKRELIFIIVVLCMVNLILLNYIVNLKQDFYASLLKKECEIVGLEVEIDEKVKEIENIQAELDKIKDLSKYELYNIPLTIDQQIFIQTECEKIGFEYKMYLAMIRQESNYKNIVGSKNSNGSVDYGLTQLNSNYYPWFAELAGLEKYDVMNIRDNVKMSLAYIKYIKNRWSLKGIDVVYTYNKGNPSGNLESEHTKKVKKYYSELGNLKVEVK